MARMEWGGQGRGKWCSYKRMAVIVCSINIVIALFVFRCLYSSLYLYSDEDLSQYNVKYTPDQIKKMEDAIQIRKESEPVELEGVVKHITEKLDEQRQGVELPGHVRQMVRDGILERLRSLPFNASLTEQREAVENWRKEKMEEVKPLIAGKKNGSWSISADEAAKLLEAMQTKWSMLMDEIGLWIPPEFNNKEHDDKPEGLDELEEDPLPGRPLPPECHAERHSDYSGAAVRWGLTHHKESAADCCEACMDQARNAKPGEKRCNIWVYCPSETGCYSPDIYEHKHQECWLKYSENPKLNFKERYPESYRSIHPTAPLVVPWVSGVISV